MTSGLILEKPDIRNYSHARTFGSVSKYPTEGLKRKPVAVFDQRDTNFCTGFSMAGAMSFKLGFPVSPEFMVAIEGEVAGFPILGGTTMDMAPKALTTFGLIKQEDCPVSLAKDGPDKVSEWANYPKELWDKAKDYIQGAYYTAHTGPYDAYDNIISTIYKAHQEDEDIAVQMGTAWYGEFNVAALNKLSMPLPTLKPTNEHAWVIFDWNGDNAYALLSQGKTWGKDGVLVFPREVVNFLFKDSYATTRVMRDKDITDGSYKGQVIQYLLDALHKLLSLYQTHG